jgi:hypothetical protein
MLRFLRKFLDDNARARRGISARALHGIDVVRNRGAGRPQMGRSFDPLP